MGSRKFRARRKIRACTNFRSARIFALREIRTVREFAPALLVTPKNLYRYKLRKIIMTGICIGIN